MGMSSHPDWDWVEVPTQAEFGGATSEGVALPTIYTEGLDYSEVNSVLDVFRNIYGNAELLGPTVRAEWEQLTQGEDGEDAFAKACFAYMLYPDSLRLEQPERYQFLKELVFYGIEYTLNRETGSDSGEGSQELSKLAYLDYDNQNRQIEVTSNGTWVVATGEKIA